MNRNFKFSALAVSLGIVFTGVQFKEHLSEQFKFGKTSDNHTATESDGSDVLSFDDPSSLKSSEELKVIYDEGVAALSESDYAAALAAFEEAAMYTYAPAMHQLALMLEIGQSTTIDTERAFQLYKDAAEMGYLNSIRYLAVAFETGILGATDLQESIRYYRLAARNRDIESLSWLRDQAKSNPQFATPEELAQWNMILSANGDIQATIDVGMALYTGNGLELDKEAAIDKFEEAAEQGDDSSHTFLASILLYDTDVERNPAEAVTWLNKSAERGNPRAQAMLGIAISSLNDLAPEGIVIDDTKAFEWVSRSLDQECPLAYSYAGQMYLASTGVEEDLEKAVELFQKGAELGNADAMVNLGWQLAHGQGIEKDEKKAFDLIKTAADTGYPNALFNLGWMYENGIGIKQNYRKALEFYEKSTDLKDPSGTYNLAVLYELGKGLIADKKKALELYQLAHKRGDTRAIEKINTLSAEG